MSKYPSYFKFYTDISGVPNVIDPKTGFKQDVVLALASVSKRSIRNTLNNFERHYNGYWIKKGHQLRDYELKEIIEYFDRYNVKMLTINFDSTDWDKYSAMYPKEVHFGAKTMAILYFFILKNLARKKFMYEAVLDNDTSFNIHQSIVICQRLMRMYKYDFDITLGHRDINIELRLPDWIAQARRKLDCEYLESLDNFKILKNKLPKLYRLRVYKSVKI